VSVVFLACGFVPRLRVWWDPAATCDAGGASWRRQGEEAAVATAAAVWAAAPQRAAQAIDRLLALRLVRAPHHSQLFGSCSVHNSVSPAP